MTVKVKEEKEWQVIIILSGPDKADEIQEFYQNCRLLNSFVSSVTVRPHVKKRDRKS